MRGLFSEFYGTLNMLNLFFLVARNYICDFISISHKRNKSVLHSNRCLLFNPPFIVAFLNP